MVTMITMAMTIRMLCVFYGRAFLGEVITQSEFYRSKIKTKQVRRS